MTNSPTCSRRGRRTVGPSHLSPIVVPRLISTCCASATVPLLRDVANPSTLGGTTPPATGPPHTSAPMSIYRTPSGFRPSAEPEPAEQSTTPPPITVRALLDSATLALPDTSEFTFR